MTILVFLAGFIGATLLSFLAFFWWWYEVNINPASSLVDKLILVVFTIIVAAGWFRLFSSFDIALII